MKFSLVLSTRGRTDELRRFLRSLADQEHEGTVELLLVDQNPDDRLAPIIAEYRDRIHIVHLRSEPGLSRGRNVGLAHANGDVVAFPDDDCRYTPGVLAAVEARLQDPGVDGVTGRGMDEQGREVLSFDRQAGLLTRRNVFRRVVSYTLFLRTSVVEAVGPFDEAMGPGAGTLWWAGEEMDYTFRVVDAGFAVFYDPAIVALHPATSQDDDAAMLERTYHYRAGFGRICRKHFSHAYALYHFLRLGAGVLLALLRLRPALARYRWYGLRGMVRGWLT